MAVEIFTPPPTHLSLAHVQRNANMVLVANTWTLVTFDTEIEDNDDYWAAAPNPTRIVVPKAGQYYISAQWHGTEAINRAMGCSIRRNGEGQIKSNTVGYAGQGALLPGNAGAFPRVVNMPNAGDYVEVYIMFNAAQTVDFVGAIIFLIGLP